jgi:hypothetical protein
MFLIILWMKEQMKAMKLKEGIISTEVPMSLVSVNEHHPLGSYLEKDSQRHIMVTQAKILYKEQTTRPTKPTI